jgi:hypothetical protein
MFQRVVGGHRALAEDLTKFIMGTYVGIGSLMYGIYWLIDKFTPTVLSEDLGLLLYVVAPGAILLSAFSLIVIILCAISFGDLITQTTYACGISYLSTPLIREEGWIGYSDIGKVITYVLVYVVSFGLIKILVNFPIVLKSVKVIAGLVFFGLLLSPFWKTTTTIIEAAGWY